MSNLCIQYPVLSLLLPNRGRHKFVTAKGVITQTYPNIFLVELENADGNDQNKTVSFSYQDVITRDVRMMLLEN